MTQETLTNTPINTEWLEAHHEIVKRIELEIDNAEVSIIGSSDMFTKGGTGALWEAGIEWTNEFVRKNEDRQWDGEFFDELDSFFTEKLNRLKL